MVHHHRILFVLGFAVLTAIGCASEPKAVYPGEAWESYSDIEAAGFSADGLAALEAAIAAGNTHSMMVIRNGRIVYSYGDVTQTEGTYLASVRKSILAMLMGEHVKSGAININATLAELGVDDVQGLTDREKTATLRDIISARWGSIIRRQISAASPTRVRNAATMGPANISGTIIGISMRRAASLSN